MPEERVTTGSEPTEAWRTMWLFRRRPTDIWQECQDHHVEQFVARGYEVVEVVEVEPGHDEQAQ